MNSMRKLLDIINENYGVSDDFVFVNTDMGDIGSSKYSLAHSGKLYPPQDGMNEIDGILIDDDGVEIPVEITYEFMYPDEEDYRTGIKIVSVIGRDGVEYPLSEIDPVELPELINREFAKYVDDVNSGRYLEETPPHDGDMEEGYIWRDDEVKEGADEQLDEISGDTLRSYLKRAEKNIHHDMNSARIARAFGDYERQRSGPEVARDWDDEEDWLRNRAERRSGGAARAISRLASRGEHIGEGERDWRDEDNWHSRTMAKFKTYSPEQLRHVIRDAGEAAASARSMGNDAAAGRYEDEAQYAAMELRRRRGRDVSLQEMARGMIRDILRED